MILEILEGDWLLGELLEIDWRLRANWSSLHWSNGSEGNGRRHNYTMHILDCKWTFIYVTTWLIVFCHILRTLYVIWNSYIIDKIHTYRMGRQGCRIRLPFYYFFFDFFLFCCRLPLALSLTDHTEHYTVHDDFLGCTMLKQGSWYRM